MWNKLKAFLSDPVALKSQAVRWIGVNNEQNGWSQKEKEQLQKKIDGIAEEEMRYAKAYGSGVLNFEQFTSLAGELKSKKQAILTKMENVDKSSKTDRLLNAGEVDKLCLYAKEILTEMGVEDRKNIIHEKVIINNSGEIEVRGSLPEFSQKLGQYAKSRNRRSAKRG
jgi:hypothetical protein